MKINEQNKMGGRVRHLSQGELETLVTGCEGNQETWELVKHLDQCNVCQERITSLVADDGDWGDAQTMLSGDDLPRWEPDLSQADFASHDSREVAESLYQQVLRLVGAPNHPEMLGRLGRYDIERIIGSGGMGIVLKAHDSELSRPIAIKLLAPELCHNGAARERFAREGRAAAAVVHEHVISIHNVESGGPVPFLVMQYVPGRSLDARVTEDGPLGVEEILRIRAQAAAGLAAAHRQGLVHRDVKPANILLENSVERAILTDFGLARAIDDASLTRTGILAGTPHYMSPEQAQGKAIDHRSDLFSLGSALYFMATGHPPFRGSTAFGVLHRICREPHRPVWKVNKDIPDELSEIIDRLLAKKPGQRFATAEDVQDSLARLLSKHQSVGLGRRRFRSWRRLSPRRRVLWIAGAAAVCIAAVGGAVWRASGPSGVGDVAGPPVAVNASHFELRESQELEATYANELVTALSEIGATQQTGYYCPGGNDAWRSEVEGIKRSLSNIELQKGSFNKQ